MTRLNLHAGNQQHIRIVRDVPGDQIRHVFYFFIYI